MPVHQLSKLNLQDLHTIPKDRSVVLVPVGPIEEHGPHLPLGTDAILAEFYAEKIKDEILVKSTETHIVVLPTFYSGSDVLVMPGSVEINPQTLRGLLYQTCVGLADAGFKKIIFVSSHGGPRHVVVLDEVCSKLKWRKKVKAISVCSAILFDVLNGKFADKISDRVILKGHQPTTEEREALKKDYHGGMLETSLMLLAHPDLVHVCYSALEAKTVSSVFKINKGTAKKLGPGYIGYPSYAKKVWGEATLEVFMEEIFPDILSFLKDEKMKHKFISPLYYVPFFRTDFKILVFVLINFALFFFLFWFFNQWISSGVL
jgi:creatinine amidohydrolase